MHFLDNQNGTNLLGVFGHVKIEDGVCEVFFWQSLVLVRVLLGFRKVSVNICFCFKWNLENYFQLSAMGVAKIPFIHPRVTNLPYLDLTWIQVKLKYSLPKINTWVGKCVPQRWHANQPSSIIRFWKNVLCTNCTSW